MIRTLAGLAWSGVRRRGLASVLTVVSVALGTALVVGVLAARRSADRSFSDAARGYDLILGPAKGSALQIALFTLFHADEAVGTLPWKDYEWAKSDPRVKAAVPYAVGDMFRGHRVVGTLPVLFDTLLGADRRPLGADMRGRPFREDVFEAVIGSQVAATTGLRIGDRFRVSHGLGESTGAEHAEQWEVVGVLRPTATPNDRAVFIALESFYAIEGHGDPTAPERRELSAIGLKLVSSKLTGLFYFETKAGRADVQPVFPAEQVRKLTLIVGDVAGLIGALAAAVVLVSMLSILVGLYDAIQSRRREIAILRAMGARAAHVFTVVLIEALLLCVAGALLGILLGHGALLAAAPTLLADYAVRVDPGPGLGDLVVLGAVAALGLLAGLIPAWRGLRTPVADHLHPTN